MPSLGHQGGGREKPGSFLPWQQARFLTQKKLISPSDDVVHPKLQTVMNEVGIAGFVEGSIEIKLAIACSVRNAPLAHHDVTISLKGTGWIDQSQFETCQPNQHLERGSRLILAMGRSVEQRLGPLGIHHGLIDAGGQMAHKEVGVKRWGRSHGQNVPILTIHDDHGTLHMGIVVPQRLLGGPLNATIQGEDEVFAWKAGQPGFFLFPVNQVVDQDRFGPRFSTKFLLINPLQARNTGEIGELIIIRHFQFRTFLRSLTTARTHVSQQMRSQGSLRVAPGSPDFHIKALEPGTLFHEACHLLSREVFKNRHGHVSAAGVMLLESFADQATGLPHHQTGPIHRIAHGLVTRILLEAQALGGRQLAIGLQPSVGCPKIFAKLIQIHDDVEGRLIFSKYLSLPVKDHTSRCRQSNGAVGLHLAIALVFVKRQHLDMPKPDNDQHQ